MANAVQINASAIGGTIVTQNSGVLTVPASGIISVFGDDVTNLLRAGAQYVAQGTDFQTVTNPRPASAARIVTSTTVSNATLAIANQPDVPRQCAAVIYGGTVSTGITAGNLAITYVANDGTNTTDNFSMVTLGSTNLTLTTSKAVLTLTSAIESGLVGTTGAGIQINDTNSLGMMVGPGFSNFSVLKEAFNGVNETIGTVATSAASITPTTTPATTNTYAFAYSFQAPTL